VNEIKALADSVVANVKEFVSRALVPVFSRLDDFERRLAAIPAGAKGDAGERGERGESGAAGIQGVDGKDGTPGVDGAAGERGVDGRDGKNGIDGKDGAKGKDFDPTEMHAAIAKAVGEIPRPLNGKDADEDAIVARVLANIPVPKDGALGVNGKDFDPAEMHAAIGKAISALPRPSDGKDADEDAMVARVLANIPIPKDGAPGRDFDPAELYSAVAKAVADLPKPKDGRDGRDAKDGRPGEDGEPGRDALEIDILPAIDEAKAYPRGTYANYAGGTIRAFRTTDPVVDGDVVAAGWQVLWEGVRSLSFHAREDGRTFVFSALTTSGASFVQEVPTALVIYRDVFVSGRTYDEGDAVTWGGSTWIARKTTDTTPGDGNDWRLAVKRGRDGKDK